MQACQGGVQLESLFCCQEENNNNNNNNEQADAHLIGTRKPPIVLVCVNCVC